MGALGIALKNTKNVKVCGLDNIPGQVRFGSWMISVIFFHNCVIQCTLETVQINGDKAAF